MRPAVRRIYERFFTGGLVLAAMTEDRPYLDNRLLPCDRPSVDGRQRSRIQYPLHTSEIERPAAFLRQSKEVLETFRKINVGVADMKCADPHRFGTAILADAPNVGRGGWDQITHRASVTKPLSPACCEEFPYGVSSHAKSRG